MNSLSRNLLLLLLLLSAFPVMAQRTFRHPGLSYTQADLDRMKAMYEAKVEPFYSGFIALRDQNFYTRYRDINRPFPTTQSKDTVIWDNPNLWLDGFGQIAHNNALIWHVTGDTYYADRAVTVLNRYKNIHSVKPYGTNPLDASKVYRLLEGAELMRDYPGWKAEDQQAFRDFLLYPGYSTTEDYYKKYSDADTVKNKVTIYWNIFQGDPQRHGNQGLYAMRSLLAMGVYLDNDTIYDRAYRKIMSQPHRPYDLAYPIGPNYGTEKVSAMPDFYRTWNLNATGTTEDYGSDDELKYWIYENGQCQEAARDQGHILDCMVGVTNSAQIAWNQGDDLFTAYDYRLLKGINYVAKYTYSWTNNHSYGEAYWKNEPDWEPTVENGEFLNVRSRNNRWESLKINPYSESDSTWSRGKRFNYPVQMYMAYKVMLGQSDDDLLWLKRAYTVDMDSLRQAGLSTPEYLVNYRTAWMAGNGGTFSNGKHVSGLPVMPGTVKAVDYDFFNDSVSGNGHTYYNSVARTEQNYRTEGGIPVKNAGGTYVITGLSDGAWMNYTFRTSATSTMEVSMEACASKAVTIGFAVDGGKEETVMLSATDGFQSVVLGKVNVPAGARVLRIHVHGAEEAIDIKNITMESATADADIAPYQWNSRDYVAASGSILADQNSYNLYSTSYSSATQPTFTITASDRLYRVAAPKLYLVMKGSNLDHAAMKKAMYRLSDTGADVSKSSTAGQANHYTVTADDGGTLAVWKLDYSSSSRVTPLLKECYTSGNDSYILRALSLLVYGTSVRLSTNIDDIDFLSDEEMVTKYPELSSITGVEVLKEDVLMSTGNSIYNLQGQKVGNDAGLLPHGIYIKDNKKVLY